MIERVGEHKGLEPVGIESGRVLILGSWGRRMRWWEVIHLSDVIQVWPQRLAE